MTFTSTFIINKKTSNFEFGPAQFTFDKHNKVQTRKQKWHPNQLLGGYISVYQLIHHKDYLNHSKNSWKIVLHCLFNIQKLQHSHQLEILQVFENNFGAARSTTLLKHRQDRIDTLSSSFSKVSLKDFEKRYSYICKNSNVKH